MSNAIFMIGIAMVCDTLKGIPWWVILCLIAVGVFADLFGFCDPRKG